MTTGLASQKSRPSIHALSHEERAAMMRDIYLRKSRFQKEFGMDAKDFDAGAHAEALRSQVLRLLKTKNVPVPNHNLEQLHRHVGSDLKKYGIDDGVNKISSLLYETDEAFTSAYLRFIKEAVGQYFPYPFYFQATPTVRIHCPDGMNNHHYPRYHADIGYGHPPEEINVWIPLTEPSPPQFHGFRRMDVKHSYDIMEQFGFDFTPFIERAVNDKPFNILLNAAAPEVETEFGSFTAFDSRSLHTGEPLQIHTRASIDIRIVPVEDYESIRVEYQGTGRRKIRYVPGQGYHELSSEQL